MALNPVIKFTTLFGLLAVEIAVTMSNQSLKTAIGMFFTIVALIFIYRSFYCMRIPEEKVIPLLLGDDEEPPTLEKSFPILEKSHAKPANLEPLTAHVSQ